MSAYWDNDIVRVALPPVYGGQREPGEARAAWLANIAEGLRKQIASAKEQLEIVSAMQAEYEGRICMRCYGSRKIRVQIDMDSSTSKTCPDCNGTGEPK